MSISNLRNIFIGLCNILLVASCTSADTSSKGPFPYDKIPHPVYASNPEFVELYDKAWELAWDRVKYQDSVPQSPYMDENFRESTIWIWDTEFMVLFCRYAPDVYPGIESLDNFYKCILDKAPSGLIIQHPDNPPFYPWVEWEYYKTTGNKERLKYVLTDNRYLQRHYQWFDSLKIGTQLHFKHKPILLQKEELGYRWGNVQSGMDNTPRATDAVSQDSMLWMDALAQQALAALYINRIASELGRCDIAQEYDSLYLHNKNLLNEYYWDEADRFYYDLNGADTTFIRTRTPAVYWAMLAEVPDSVQASYLAGYATDSLEFGGKYPWPTVTRRHPMYNDGYGDYWRGAVWLPTAYMATKALERYGYHDIADENARKLLQQVSDTYRQFSPHTIWECYSPSKPEPGQRHNADSDSLYLVRDDFCGWSALGPISLFIENVIGFHNIDAANKLVEWRKKGTTRQGMENLRFGNVITDIIADGDQLSVKSNNPYTLRVNGTDYPIKVGDNQFTIHEHSVITDSL